MARFERNASSKLGQKKTESLDEPLILDSERRQSKFSVVSKYHEPEEHMNIYEVPLTIKVLTP